MFYFTTVEKYKRGRWSSGRKLLPPTPIARCCDLQFLESSVFDSPWDRFRVITFSADRSLSGIGAAVLFAKIACWGCNIFCRFFFLANVFLVRDLGVKRDCGPCGYCVNGVGARCCGATAMDSSLIHAYIVPWILLFLSPLFTS